MHHSVGHVLGLQAVKSRTDRGRPLGVSRVHRLLELRLNEAGRNRRHPDVSSKETFFVNVGALQSHNN